MIKYFLKSSTFEDDSKLRDVLRSYDPIDPLTESSLAALEADILAKVDALIKAPVSAHSIFDNVWMLVGDFRQGWSVRAAAFVSVIIVIMGFLVGQNLYGTETVVAQTGALSLVALADETSEQYLSATDTSWGESDDNAK